MDVWGQGDFGGAIAHTPVHFFQRIEAHVGALVASTIVERRRGDKALGGFGFLHLVDDAGFRGHNKFLDGTLLDVLEEGRGGTDVAGVAENGGFAFGMGDRLGLGVLNFELHNFLLREGFVHHATALPQHHVAPGLFHDVAAQVAIGGKDDGLIWRNLLNQVHRIGTGADDIAHGFNLCGAIYVRNYQMSRMGGFEFGKLGGGATVGQRAPSREVWQQNELVRIEDFRGFGHEMNPREDDHIGIGLGGLAG